MPYNKKIIERTVIVFILLCTLPFIIFERDRIYTSETYSDGLPDQDSVEMLNYMHHRYNLHNPVLAETEDGFVYSDYFDINDEELVKSYYFLNNETLKEDYKGIYEQENQALKEEYKGNYIEERPFYIYERVDNVDEITEPIVSLEKYGLPYIEFMDHQHLMIENSQIDLTIDLKEESADRGLELLTEEDNRIDIDLISMENNIYQMEIIEMLPNNETNESYLFVDGETGEYDLTSSDIERYQEWLASEESKKLREAIPKVDEESGHLYISQHHIYDNDEKEIVDIEYKDLLSEDGRFVYIDGNQDDVGFGKQEIQTIDDYLKGSNTNDRSFNLSSKVVTRKMNFSNLAHMNDLKIAYFTEDFIFYEFSLGVFLSKSDQTHLIVEFEDNDPDPTVYINRIN